MGTQGNESPESTPCSTWIPDSYSGTVVILSPTGAGQTQRSHPGHTHLGGTQWVASSLCPSRHLRPGSSGRPSPRKQLLPSQEERCLLCRKLHTNSSLSSTGRCRICCPSSEPRLEKEEVLEPEYLASLPSWLLHYLPPSHPFRLGLCWI